MTAEHHLKKQLRSYLRDRQCIRSGIIQDEFPWPADYFPIMRTGIFSAFRWLCLRSSTTSSRYFGIRRFHEEPPFSFSRLAAERYHVNALRHVTKPSADETLCRYLVVELVSPDEIILLDCADVFPREWHIFDEYVIRRSSIPHQARPRVRRRDEDPPNPLPKPFSVATEITITA